MSCSGCRVLRKGCGESCMLRPCLQWIETAEAQGNATVFVAKFFGRAGLMAFISSVPEFHRPALFQSLLFEACGRTINPVSGAVGLLWTRHWDLCQVAVDTVLRGGMIGPIKEIGGEEGDLAIWSDESMDSCGLVGDLRSPVLNCGESGNISDDEMCLNREKRLLNLFI